MLHIDNLTIPMVHEKISCHKAAFTDMAGNDDLAVGRDFMIPFFELAERYKHEIAYIERCFRKLFGFTDIDQQDTFFSQSESGRRRYFNGIVHGLSGYRVKKSFSSARSGTRPLQRTSPFTTSAGVESTL